MDGARARDVERVPAGVAQAPAEVDLVGVDEERRVEAADLAPPPRGARASPPTAPSRPRRTSLAACSAPRAAGAGTARVSSAVPGDGKRHADGCCAPSGRTSIAPAAPARSSAASAACSAAVAPGSSSESSLSSRQKRPRARCSSAESFSPLPRRSVSAITSVVDRVRGARRPTEPSCEALSSTSTSVSKSTRRALARDRVQAERSSPRCSVLTTQKESSTRHGAVLHDARDASTCRVRVHLVDPAAYTPPYDRALCAALARGGRRGRAGHEPLRLRRRAAGARATRVRERFYRWRRAPPAARRRAARLAQHVPDMLRYARAARARRRRALPVAAGAAARRAACCRARRPRVLTAHDVLPREPRARPARRPAPALRARWTRSSCTPSTAPARLRDELGLDPAQGPRDPARRVRRPRRARRRAAAAELSATTRPVVLFFGLMRPYKGARRAARGVARGERPDAELWVVGHAADGHRAAACHAPPACASALRFVAGARARRRCSAPPTSSCCPTARSTSPACCSPRWRSASRCCSPRVGGFPEIAARARRSSSPPGDPDALARRSSALLADPARLRAAGRRVARRRGRPVRLGRDRRAARSRSTRRSRRRRRGPARSRPSWRGRDAPLAGVEEPGALGDPLRERVVARGSSSSISSSPSSSPPSRAAASPRAWRRRLPRASLRHPVADLAVARRLVELHHAERAEQPVLVVDGEER